MSRRQWRSSWSGGGGGGGCQVGAMTVEIDYGSVLHDCATDDVIKG